MPILIPLAHTVLNCERLPVLITFRKIFKTLTAGPECFNAGFAVRLAANGSRERGVFLNSLANKLRHSWDGLLSQNADASPLLLGKQDTCQLRIDATEAYRVAKQPLFIQSTPDQIGPHYSLTGL